MPLVIDASVVLAWLLPDEQSDAADRIIGGLISDSAQAPVLLGYEVGNALMQAARRQRIGKELHLELVQAYLALPIAQDSGSADSLLAAGTLAARHGLTLYDAAYLELALRRGLPLATFDQALSAAAGAEGLRVLQG